MKVIYFHQHFSTRSGQAGTRSYEFAKELVANGDDVEMICGRNRKSNFDFDAKGRRQIVDIEGISTHVINVPYDQKMGFMRRVLAFFSYAFWATIEGLKCPRPDVVFATSTPITVAIPGLIVSFFKRRPLVFEVRDIWPESAVSTGQLKNRFIIRAAEIFERLVYRRSVRVIALSNRMKNRMVENTGIDADKVDVIPIGADLDLFGNGERVDRFRRENGLEEKFLAVFPGAHGVANGLDVLVEAALLVPDNIRIIMIGAGGQKPRLVAKAEKLGADRILFFDPIPKTELADVMSTMNCGLMILNPLDVFATVLPNKFFDYAAAGLPILVNFPGEVADQVVNGKAGVFVEESTPENIAKTLVTMSEDRVQLEKMSQNSRLVAEKFDRRDLAKQFHRLISIAATPEKGA